MVTSCVIYKCSDKHKKDCKVGYFRLPAVRKDLDTEILALSKERRTVWLTRVNRPSDNLAEAQLAEVNSTIRVCGKHFINGRCCYESYSHTVSLLNRFNS